MMIMGMPSTPNLILAVTMSSLTDEGDRVNRIRPELAISSIAAILFRSLLAGISMLGFAIFLQWLIYVNWMDESGSLRIAGSILAGVLMFILVLRSQYSARQRTIELIARLKTIRWMNDRIRNSLQTIECVTYVHSPNATNEVRNAVDVIEDILEDFLAGSHRERNQERSGSECLSGSSDLQFR
jgi:hypothetical protein